MINKEVLELKKQFTPDNSVITKICGCYVTGEKEIRFKNKDAFNSLPEESTYHYFDLFKQTLSGSLGKNLINLEFPLSEEQTGGKQEFLYRLNSFYTLISEAGTISLLFIPSPTHDHVSHWNSEASLWIL